MSAMFSSIDINDISDPEALLEELSAAPMPRIPLGDAALEALLIESRPGTPVEDPAEIERLLGL